MIMSGWEMVNEFKRPGCGEGEFMYARGLRVSRLTGNIVVADIINKRVQILNEYGKYLHHWPVAVKGIKLCPLDVHRVNPDVVAVIIEGHASLWSCPDVTDYSGAEMKMMLSFGNDDLVFPRSVVSNEKENLFITDVGKHQLSLYDAQRGVLIRKTGGLGCEEDKFDWPYYLCKDGMGRVVVSDSHNRKLKVFDQDLNFITSFGADHLTCSTGVAYSEMEGGCFVAADYDARSLFRFSVDGRLIEVIDSDTELPLGCVDTDTRGRVYASMHHGLVVYSRGVK